MRQNIENLTTELIRLPRRERLELVRFLLFLDNRSSDSDNDIESAWEKEITDRVRAVDDGTAIGIDYDRAMQKIEKRFIQ
ncbi:addiction module protein [Desulfonema magnum]|uniref:Addiction module domain-containing protein n=1 Tax=Desulfonema magnum TaxID=45655 RepID=A0A975BV53_9BACT|nr:addiction module protein [Desulfonema magnum]QTA91705.1 Putative addiction module domain-containing protein [Desulfonema magnum]